VRASSAQPQKKPEKKAAFFMDCEDSDSSEVDFDDPIDFDDEPQGLDISDIDLGDLPHSYQLQELLKERCELCNDVHLLKTCQKFTQMVPKQRREFIQAHSRCYRCLRKSCRAATCKTKLVCKKCGRTHHTLLHLDPVQPQQHLRALPAPPQREAHMAEQIEVIDEGIDSLNSFNMIRKNEIALGVIPVVLRNPDSGRKIRVNALVDSGNNITLLSQHAADALRLSPTPRDIRIVGCGGRVTETNQQARFEVCLPKDKEIIAVSAQLMDTPAKGLKPVDWNLCKDNFKHLKRIQFPDPCQRSQVDLVLGQQVPYLISSQCKDVEGAHTEDPVARKTRLGWVASGKTAPHVEVLNSMVCRSQQASFSPDDGVAAILNDLPEMQALPAEGGEQDKKTIAQLESDGFESCQVKADTVKAKPNTVKADTNDVKAKSDEAIEPSLTKIVENQWLIEEGPNDEEPALSRIEQKALDLLQEKSKLVEGKMQMPCLWKSAPSPPDLPMNFHAVKKMYEAQMMRAEMRDEKKRKLYDDVFIDWQKRGFFEERAIGSGLFYLSHFPVIREDKTSTSVRPVFNGAARFKGKSLNDETMTGPSLINDLPQVLLHFRKDQIAIAGDVSKMFLNIRMSEEDSRYHHFFWRKDGEETKEYAFRRHIFGNAGSPCVAIFTIKDRARKLKEELPLASKVVEEATIVDDNITSVATVEEARTLIKELKQLYEGIGMSITKFISNDEQALRDLNKEEIAPNLDLAALCDSLEELPTLKTLGVVYSAKNDAFSFKIAAKEFKAGWTKRTILKMFATLYDPLGLIAPFVIVARICFQKLWEKQYNWDDEVDQSDLKKWLEWVESLPKLQQLQIPRCLRPAQHEEESLHIFVDASGEAYGAAAYLVSPEGDKVHSRLVMARAKLAPLKQVTIPRLELLGAVMGIELSKQVNKVLKIDQENVYYWTDSRNVLAWIHTEDKRLLTFVNNRVRKILNVSNRKQWRWVDTHQNPADIASRGAMPEALKEHDLWWTGPVELLKSWPTKWSSFDFDIKESSTPSTAKKEMSDKKATTLTSMHFLEVTEKVNKKEEEAFDIAKYGSWKKAVRIAAICLRWRESSRRGKNVSAEEFTRAEKAVIRLQQMRSFPIDYKNLLNEDRVLNNSSMVKLRPTIDEDGIIRMNARLRFNRNLAYEEKCPIILPSKSHLTDLIIRDVHADYNHCGGTNYTLSLLSQKYWIVHGRQEVKRVLRDCTICRRVNAKPKMQQMGPIPTARVAEPDERAFNKIGIDCAGPYSVKLTKRTRGTTADHKRYILIATCYVTRAVHFELLETLETDSTLAALQRIFSRRGVPKIIYSDNGRNFVGAANVLGEFSQNLQQIEEKFGYLYPKIQWRFNPPISPHVGGAFERHVGSMKRALATTLPQHAALTQEDLLTAVVVAEGMLNERPLAYESNDPEDMRVLTPNHFFHGKAPVEAFPGDASRRGGDHPSKFAKRWTRLNEILDDIWQRYHKEILPALNKLDKWAEKRKQIQEGDIVVLFEEKLRSVWPLGRVTKVYPGKDGLVRTVQILCNGRHLDRSLNKIRVIQEFVEQEDPREETQ